MKHLNFGIHDRNMPLADYTGRLEQLVQRMEKTGARLIWASTTPTHRTVLTSSWFMTKSMKTRFASSRLTKSPNVRSERWQRRKNHQTRIAEVF